MEALISKWHRELDLFSGIKPLLIFEGNVLDQYRYPVAGSLRMDVSSSPIGPSRHPARPQAHRRRCDIGD